MKMSEDKLKKLIWANFHRPEGKNEKTNKYEYGIRFGIGFLIAESDESLSDERATEALYKAVMNHKEYPIEKPMILSPEQVDAAIRIHQSMQEALK